MLIGLGSGGDLLDPGGSRRVNIRPIISGTLGEYQTALTSGVMAAGLAANSTVWSFRYTGANLCLIEKVILDGVGSIVAFAAGSATFRLFAARSFSASDSGGTAAVLTGNNCKLRTTYATTAVGDLRISSTAALTTGTRTLDSQPFGQVTNGFTAVAGASIPEATLFDNYEAGHHQILANNEGCILQASVPATGTWTFGITVKWTEVTASEWV